MNKDLIVYASSRDSLNYFPDNSSNNFRIQLPEEIDTNQLTSCVLVEFQHPKTRAEQLIVYLDVCSHSIISGKKAAVLRKISNKLPNSFIFPEKLLIPTKPGRYNSLHFYIVDEYNNLVSFESGSVLCTLQFKNEVATI